MSGKKHHSPFFTFAILPGIYSETSQKTTSKDIGIMRTGLLTAAVAAMLMLTFGQQILRLHRTGQQIRGGGAGFLHLGQKDSACQDDAGKEDSLHIG